MNKPPLFSVIIPTYYGRDRIVHAIRSLEEQTLKPSRFEVIVADDGHMDHTESVCSDLMKGQPFGFTFVETLNPMSGPGIAREHGVSAALGEYVVFLDDDDFLEPSALEDLEYCLDCQFAKPDLIAFDFEPFPKDPESSGRGKRTDLMIIQDRATRLQQYLQLRMDGSVIYTAFRRDFLLKLPAFRPGIHEDVDFMWFAYQATDWIAICPRPIYRKTQRPGAITQRITRTHIDGFFAAWRAIALGDPPLTQEQVADYRIGLTAVIATRLREIVRKADREMHRALYLRMMGQIDHTKEMTGHSPDLTLTTQYGILARTFLDAPKDTLEESDALTDQINALLRKSWSCQDLHHSVFFAPTEVRTCCKRFMVNGEMKGDVVILTENDPITPTSIMTAKRRLVRAINSGMPTPCSGCPFMQFKEWGDLNLELHTISIENDTRCNLQCSYCSDVFYGGVRPHYDVPEIVTALQKEGKLSRLSSVVYGGGEPTIRKDFPALISQLQSIAPKARQRVLTNAVKMSKPLRELLEQGKATITTSVDAGTAETFKAVRGKKLFAPVVRNLSAYADANPNQVTIKYIFTQKNTTEDEVQAFVGLVKQNHWQACAFQISADYQSPLIDPTTLDLMVMMHGRLRQAGVLVVYLDDHVFQRIPPYYNRCGSYIESPFDLTTKKPRLVMIWGAGWNARLLIEKSHFFRIAQVAAIVDNTDALIGTDFMGFTVHRPDILTRYDLPIILAATTNYRLLSDRAVQMGIDPWRILRKVIL